MPSSALHLVLDLDETLIYGDESLTSHLRPGALEFLDFCFENFESVRIWTAASEEWWEYNRKLHFRKYNFDEILTSDKCVVYLDYDDDYALQRRCCKPLAKLWKRRAGALTPDNTLIIDDDASNSIRNYGNAIEIDAYGKVDEKDNALAKMEEKLKTIIDLYSKTQSVRAIHLNHEPPEIKEEPSMPNPKRRKITSD